MIFGFILFVVLTLVAAGVLGALLYCVTFIVLLIQRRNTQGAYAILVFPLKLIPYFILAMLVNAIFTSAFRDVDPPFTDYWHLDLGNSRYLSAIDTTDQWDIHPTLDGSEPLVTDIARLYASKELIIGEKNSGGFFMLAPHQLTEYKPLTTDAFNETLETAGLKESELKTPKTLYRESREMGDLLTFIVMMLYPLYRMALKMKEIMEKPQ